MIYEYAIEPELAASWHDPRAARFFLAQMGLGTPRVACEFPKSTWKATVMAALSNLIADPVGVQNARKRLDALLRHIGESGTARDALLSEKETWLEGARRENGKRAFRGILVRNAPYTSSTVLEADTFEPTCAAWAVDGTPVARNKLALVKRLEPLLLFSTEVRLVDPFFDAKKERFREPTIHLLGLVQQRPGTTPLRVEIHTTVESEGNDLRLAEAHEKAKSAVAELTGFVGARLTVVLFIWTEIANGEKLHNRFVLTPHGGVVVPHGLDQAHPNAKQTDDVTVLPRAQFMARWSQYAESTTAFRALIPPTKIGR